MCWLDVGYLFLLLHVRFLHGADSYVNIYAFILKRESNTFMNTLLCFESDVRNGFFLYSKRTEYSVGIFKNQIITLIIQTKLDFYFFFCREKQLKGCCFQKKTDFFLFLFYSFNLHREQAHNTINSFVIYSLFSKL